MRNLLKKYNIAFFAVFLILMIAVFFAYSRTKQQEVMPPAPEVFEITSVYPTEGTYEVVLPNLAIEFFFNEEVDLSSFAIKSTPFDNFSISYGKSKKSVVITPEVAWQMDTEYLFTVTARSVSGTPLESPASYRFKFTPLKVSDLEESY